MGYKFSKSKYNAHKVALKGVTYDSHYERDRAIKLMHMQRMGEISGLRRQVKFVIIPRTVRTVELQLKTKTKKVQRVVEMEATYHCDFLYKEDDKYIIEEFKSEMTASLADYILRRKLMVRKIQEHNAKGRSQWVFREVVYGKKTIITDK